MMESLLSSQARIDWFGDCRRRLDVTGPRAIELKRYLDKLLSTLDRRDVRLIAFETCCEFSFSKAYGVAECSHRLTE
ncbi:hypothetical protein [Burkholderia multivorans]|uniref:hypothetical protein n=1 Tax=Burkholderia multivorans TaxID=87883 RepID=UPI00158E0582|nr:hypothetical protein [Burkholderia multivorans]